jgi:hypothetical protein
MKFMLVVIITLGVQDDPKQIEMRIPQANKEECLKSAKTFKFSLPVISIDTRCEPKRVDEEPEIRGV